MVAHASYGYIDYILRFILVFTKKFDFVIVSKVLYCDFELGWGEFDNHPPNQSS
jgi:hypothetical protein